MLSLLGSAFLFIAFTSALVLTPVASDTIAQPAIPPNLANSPTGPWKSANSTNSATAVLGSNSTSNVSLTYPGSLVYTCDGQYGGFDLNLQDCLEVLRLLVVVPFPFVELTWSDREFAQGLPLPQRYMSCKYRSLGRFQNVSDKYSCKPTEPASSNRIFFQDEES